MLGQELVPFLLSTHAIQIAATILALGIENRYCLELISLILEGPPKTTAGSKVFLALGDTVLLVEALSELREETDEPDLAEKADKTIGFITDWPGEGLSSVKPIAFEFREYAIFTIPYRMPGDPGPAIRSRRWLLDWISLTKLRRYGRSPPLQGLDQGLVGL
jgi:hypothetical protein